MWHGKSYKDRATKCPPQVRERESALDSRLSELLGWKRRADPQENGNPTAERVRKKLWEFQRDNTEENA